MPTKLPTQNLPHIIGVGTFSASARAKQLVMQVLDSNRITYGPMMQRFEADFAKLHSCRFGIMSNSGTSALQLAIQAMKELHGWADGDEIIVPAVTFVATANIVLHNRMVPVLVDVDSSFYEMDPELIERAITPRTRAIIPVHLFGQPADMAPIIEIAKKHSLKIVEDSAESMFADYQGQRVGSLGDIGCFSTYVAHLLVTGVGGLNTTNNPEYAVKIRSLLNHGRDSIYISIDDDNDTSPAHLRTIIERRFRFMSIGHSFRATEMEAALGLAQLEEWKPAIEQRRRNAAFLTQVLKKLDNHFQTPAIRAGCDHSFMMYPIVLRKEPKRRLIEFLETNGIETRDMLPLTNQPIYHRLLGWKEDDYAVAKWVNNNGFYIGCHQNLTGGDLEYIVETIERYFQGTQSRESLEIALVMGADRNTTSDHIANVAKFSGLFSKTFVIDSGIDPAVRLDAERNGYEIIPAQGKDELGAFLGLDHKARFDAATFFPLNGQWDPADLPRLIMALNRGCDMVVASRFVIGGGRRGRHGAIRSLGNRVFNLIANLLFAGNFSDSFSSFRALRRGRLASASLPKRGMINYFSLSLDAMKGGWRVQEVPTVELTRSSAQVIGDSVRTVLPALFILIRKSWSGNNDSSE